MIFIRVSSKDYEQILEIAELLIEEKLAIDINIKKSFHRLEMVKNKLVSSDIYLLTAKTKALLFSNVNQKLKEKYKNKMPEVFSTPIVHMDFDQAKNLTDTTLRV